ncbi:MAG: helix-turn-helix transcriptional regulator [Nitrospirae bacterium]|nr:helix-turn-helix transcriptional regulator [Nitrospirota bacterium]
MTAWRLNLQWNKDKIKTLRKGLGLTQQQFAEKLGVSKRAVIYWEKGKRSPSSEILTKLDDLTRKIE